jgi:hypothetical protein
MRKRSQFNKNVINLAPFTYLEFQNKHKSRTDHSVHDGFRRNYCGRNVLIGMICAEYITQSPKEVKVGRKKEALKKLHNTCLVLTKVRQYLAVEESSYVVLYNIGQTRVVSSASLICSFSFTSATNRWIEFRL